jgi:hypothetical protein
VVQEGWKQLNGPTDHSKKGIASPFAWATIKYFDVGPVARVVEIAPHKLTMAIVIKRLPDSYSLGWKAAI